MGGKHIAEVLTEASKKISALDDEVQQADSVGKDKERWIREINDVISSLDHLVEDLEKTGK